MLEGLGRIGFGLFGLAVLIGIVWLFSNNKKAVDWKLVATGVTLQIALRRAGAAGAGRARTCSTGWATVFVKILSFVNAGSSFIFGSLMDVEASASSSPSRCCRPSSSSPR